MLSIREIKDKYVIYKQPVFTAFTNDQSFSNERVTNVLHERDSMKGRKQCRYISACKRCLVSLRYLPSSEEKHCYNGSLLTTIPLFQYLTDNIKNIISKSNTFIKEFFSEYSLST